MVYGPETQLILQNIVAWVLFNEFSSSEGQILDFALKKNFRLSEHEVQPELHMVRFLMDLSRGIREKGSRRRKHAHSILALDSSRDSCAQMFFYTLCDFDGFRS